MGVTVIKKDGGGGGSTAWGDITGTLADQTDLQTALDSAGGFWDLSAVQTSDETVTNSTTLVDSTDLQISLESGKAYLIDWALAIDDNDNAGASNAGFKFEFVFTGTTTVEYIWSNELVSFGLDRTFFNDFSSMTFNSRTGWERGSVNAGKAYIVTTSTGTLKVQFAQNSANSSDTAYLRKGSYLLVKEGA